ncbi:S49 family peptidase [Pararhodobacter sp.]|uniref:S49 family peptidase n=1 Tax=Pararhodobacter sp. TaxID=2127056 RepID=UPI002FE0F326
MDIYPTPALVRLAPGALLGHLPAAQGDFLAWAEARAAKVLAACGARPAGPRWTDDAVADAEKGIPPYALVDGLALIGIKGLIVPELEIINWSWATGCAELCWQVEHAADNAQVSGIALLVNSPGGYISGVDEAHGAILSARASKPVIAAVQDMAYSAGYWLASAADQISAPRLGGVGHVGTLATHFDLSEALKKQGITATVMQAGALKADGHPYLPLSDTARQEIEARLQALRTVFAESVAEGRRGAISADEVLATEARAFDGPEGIAAALSAGLIDAILPAQEAIGLFATHLAGASG